MTHCRSYVHQNVEVVIDHVPRSGELTCEAMHHPRYLPSSMTAVCTAGRTGELLTG
jgi:hypothetical protein